MSYRDTHTRHAAHMRVFLAILFVVISAYAQIKDNVAYPGFQLLEEPTTPRLLAMGSAGTAAEGSGFAYYNPAMPFFGLKRYLTAEYGRSPGDLQRGHFETALPFSPWFIAASVHTETINDIFGTPSDGKLPNYQVPFSSQLSNISIGLGYIKNDYLALALSVSGIQERIENEYAYAASVSAGLAFKLIPEKFHLGLSAFHLGTATSFMDTTMDWGDGSDLPMSGRLGVSWQDTVKMIPYTINGDIVYRNADKRVMVPAGLELRPIPPLAIRMGKIFNRDTEIINLGCGLDISPLAVDMSIVIPKLRSDTELKWLVGITYTMKGPSDTPTKDEPNELSPAPNHEDSQKISEDSADTLTNTKENKDLPDTEDNSTIEKSVSDTTGAASSQPKQDPVPVSATDDKETEQDNTHQSESIRVPEIESAGDSESETQDSDIPTPAEEQPENTQDGNE